MVARGGAQRNPWWGSSPQPIEPRRGDGTGEVAGLRRPSGARRLVGVASQGLRSPAASFTPGYHPPPLRGSGPSAARATGKPARPDRAISAILEEVANGG
jgi:hypothetical protein